jgi:hypothetical protein
MLNEIKQPQKILALENDVNSTPQLGHKKDSMLLKIKGFEVLISRKAGTFSALSTVHHFFEHKNLAKIAASVHHHCCKALPNNDKGKEK